MLAFLRNFVIAFAVFFGMSSYMTYSTARSIGPIANDPVFSTANHSDTVTRWENKRFEYRLTFDYRVNGQTYQIHSGWVDERRRHALAARPADIVYNRAMPSQSAFKTRYDAYQSSNKLPRAHIKRLFLSLLGALVVALGMLWQSSRQ